jgi:putative phage-type endonuclease
VNAEEAAVTVQGTVEWKRAKYGNVGASQIRCVIAKGKSGGESATREDFKAQVVIELLSGIPYEDDFTSKEMSWGVDNEPFARAAYEISRGVMVDKCGFIFHPTIERSGASPDGLVGSDGLLEIKCPKPKTHMRYILAGRVPTDYVPQMQWQMACTGRPWNDFASYDPRMPEHLQLFVKRLPRDNEYIGWLESEVRQFNAEVDEIVAKLSSFSRHVTK